jgi:ABC-type uncharacterized transport system involved in gliding motility auxiliary subunit
MKTNRNELGKLAAMLGAALLISGLVRYSVQNLWGFNLGLVIGGAVLLVVGLVLNASGLTAFFTGRSGKLGTNTAVLTLAVVGILAIVNFLGYRHHKRFDFTSEQLYSLSDQTRKVVANLPKDVKVIKFDKREDPALKDLMSEYKGAGRRISYEFVDPESKPEIAKQYKVAAFGETIVSAGDRQEKLESGKTSEQELTNALLKVTRDSLKMVCFTEGHGERAMSGGGAEGFDTADKRLKNENYETKAISLASGTGVPAECAVLVVAGPKQPLLPPETAMIGKYLDGGGKVMFLLDPDTDPQVGDVLKNYNIEVGNNTVLDVSAAGQMFGGGPLAPLVMSYGSHPITERLTRNMSIFPMARQVKINSGGGVNAQTLLTTSEASWAESEIKAGVSPEYNEGTDVKGPVTLGAAASKSLGDKKEARLVVIGDSDFATNRAINFQRNGDLFLNSINWLAQDEDLIAIRPKSATSRSVTMTESQQRIFFWFTVALLPLLVMGTGTYVWWKRR